MRINRNVDWYRLGLLLASVFAAHGLAQATADKLFEIGSISVKGTRLPSASVIRLSGINLHDKVNDAIVIAACHKITSTGLVKTVDYAYDAYPDRPAVTLNLTIADEGPLLPASIKPATEENTLWSSIQTLDAIFTRELPPTEKALAFYSKNLEKCLQRRGRNDEYASSSVTADSSGKLTGIVFEIRRYKTLSRQ